MVSRTWLHPVFAGVFDPPQKHVSRVRWFSGCSVPQTTPIVGRAQKKNSGGEHRGSERAPKVSPDYRSNRLNRYRSWQLPPKKERSRPWRSCSPASRCRSRRRKEPSSAFCTGMGRARDDQPDARRGGGPERHWRAGIGRCHRHSADRAGRRRGPLNRSPRPSVCE